MGLDVTGYKKLLPAPTKAELVSALEQLGQLEDQYPDAPYALILDGLPIPKAELGRIADWLSQCLKKRKDGEPITEDMVTEGLVEVSAHIIAYTEKNFPGRTQGLVAGTYSYEDSFDFCAGSYGGYNRWRDWLARAAGHGSATQVWETIDEGPFVELINFPDNEGVIGPVVSIKLARDFIKHQVRIEATGDEWNVEQYRRWMKAFELAAFNGAVVFH